MARAPKAKAKKPARKKPVHAKAVKAKAKSARAAASRTVAKKTAKKAVTKKSAVKKAAKKKVSKPKVSGAIREKIELGAPNGPGGYIFITMLDIPTDMEPAFNDAYNNDHITKLSTVPGVRSVARFQVVSSSREKDMPRYLAIYVLESADTMETEAWKTASAAGNWRPMIRPHTFNRESHIWRLLDITSGSKS